jgi:type II secretory pathway component PulM
MTYDLRRLRLKGIIQRIAGTNRYMLTGRGLRWALFITKVYCRIVRPLSQRIDPDLPNEARQELRAAFNAFDKAVDAVVKEAQIHP